VLNLSTGPLHLVIGGGKDGELYLLDGDSMGGSGDTNARHHFNVGHAIFETAAFWNNTLYIAPVGASMRAYAFNTSINLFNTTPTSQSVAIFGFPGSTPSVSATGAGSNGIVWGYRQLELLHRAVPGLRSRSPARVQRDESRDRVVEQLDGQRGRRGERGEVHGAHGGQRQGVRRYARQQHRGAFGSTTISGELDVYGLKP